MNKEFTIQLAQQLNDSNQLIDFDWAWQVLGYSRKDSGKRTLVSYFEKNFDYFVQRSTELLDSLPYEVFHLEVENSNAGRPVEKIYLTVECFKQMGMLSKSEQGRKIRKYFLRCETVAKQSLRVIPQMQRDIEKLQSQIQSLLPTPADFIPPGWKPETWESLEPQDRQYFLRQYREHGFKPGNDAEVKALPIGDRDAQAAEIAHLINDVPEEDKEFIEKSRKFSLQRFFKFWDKD